MRIEFTVPGVPVAQPRQRHRVVKQAGGKVFVQNYTPTQAPVNAFKAACAMAARQAYSGPPVSLPIKCKMVFVMPRPSRLIWKSRPMPREPFVAKPDRDNLEKAVGDALSGIIWVDDRQIYAGPVEKWIAAGDEQAHTLVTVVW